MPFYKFLFTSLLLLKTGQKNSFFPIPSLFAAFYVTLIITRAVIWRLRAGRIPHLFQIGANAVKILQKTFALLRRKA